MFKNSCVLILVLLALSLPSEGTKKGVSSITEGTHSKEDTKLYYKNIKTKGNLVPNTVHSKDICFPDNTDKRQTRFTITEYSIKDVGMGGLTYVQKGGLGKHKLCFHVMSQPGKGYNFEVQIWGKYDK